MNRLCRWMLYLMAPLCPVWCSKFVYKKTLGRKLNLENPVTLDEKLMWLKLNRYQNNLLVTQCADKYAVRDYVEQAGYGAILNELYGVWNRADQIPWKDLPDQFVLKWNHASGFNWICRDKKLLDIRACKKQLDKWMRRDFWRYSAEVQYRHIPKKIICEKMLGKNSAPVDYKFYCFHGEPMYVLVCYEREKGSPRFYFFDMNWKFMPITKDGQKESSDFTLPRPARFSEMVEYARGLAQPFPFVRVDLYAEGETVIFGELTFTPSACMDVGRLPETDLLFGNLLDLDRK